MTGLRWLNDANKQIERKTPKNPYFFVYFFMVRFFCRFSSSNRRICLTCLMIWCHMKSAIIKLPKIINFSLVFLLVFSNSDDYNRCQFSGFPLLDVVHETIHWFQGHRPNTSLTDRFIENTRFFIAQVIFFLFVLLLFRLNMSIKLFFKHRSGI